MTKANMDQLAEKYCEIQNLFPPGTPIAIVALHEGTEPVTVIGEGQRVDRFVKALVTTDVEN